MSNKNCKQKGSMLTYVRRKGGAKAPSAQSHQELGSSLRTLEPGNDDPYEFNIDLTGGASPLR